MLRLIVLLILISSPLAYSFDCSEYLKIKESKKCTEAEFFLFSQKRCLHYQNQKTENKKTQSFINEVRECLIQETQMSPCDQIWNKNITDHTQCFKRYGYCEMNFSQRWEIFVLTGFPSEQSTHYFKIFWDTLFLC